MPSLAALQAEIRTATDSIKGKPGFHRQGFIWMAGTEEGRRGQALLRPIKDPTVKKLSELTLLTGPGRETKMYGHRYAYFGSGVLYFVNHFDFTPRQMTTDWQGIEDRLNEEVTSGRALEAVQDTDYEKLAFILKQAP